MKSQYISATSKESDDQACEMLSEDQWVSYLLIFLLQILFNIWLDKCFRQVCTECLLLKADWESKIISYISRFSIGWLYTTFNNFRHYRQKWNRSVIFGFYIFPFLSMGLTFAVLQASGDFERNYMLRICNIDSVGILAPSFMILQNISSRPQSFHGQHCTIF